MKALHKVKVVLLFTKPCNTRTKGDLMKLVKD